MAIRDRLVALDRKLLGGANDPAVPHVTARWATWLAALMPVLIGGVTFTASLIDLGAAVGILIGSLLTLPLALVARASGRVPSR